MQNFSEVTLIGPSFRYGDWFQGRYPMRVTPKGFLQ